MQKILLFILIITSNISLSIAQTPPAKLPKIIEKTIKSKTKTEGGLTFQAIVLTKTPAIRKAAVSTIEWPEILKSNDSKVQTKLNQALKALAFTDYGEMLEPEINDEKKVHTLLYGESLSTVEVVNVSKNYLTVSLFRSTMAPGLRSYDDKSYMIYDLKSGDVVPVSALFKSQKGNDLFLYWVSDRFKNNLDYHFPKRWAVNTTNMTTGSLIIIPTLDGIKILVGDVFGGHHVEEEVGVVPYSVIPSEWMKEEAKGAPITTSPLVKPHLICKPGLESVEEQWICNHKLNEDYDQLMLKRQKQLEADAGNEILLMNTQEQHLTFLNQFSACDGKEKSCIKKIIDDEAAKN